jgi:hypothetical protein
MSRSAIESVLDDICRGVADDVYRADQARRLLEELDAVIEAINRTGIGIQFFAGLQMILQHELILGVTRVYEPYSSRNPGRTLAAATHHIATHAAELRVLNRGCLVQFLTSHRESRQAIEQLSDEQLSLTLAGNLDTHIPRADSTSASPLDQALGDLKTVRDKAIAHHDRVSYSSLLVPSLSHLVDLINTARETVTLVAQAYLSVGYNLASDASRGAQSLRGLLIRAGLSQNPGLQGQ